jgi:isopenicillin N synthase-like dioxygenase
MQSLPVIDFSAFAPDGRTGEGAARQAVAEAIGLACRDYGFFLLANHGLKTSVIDTAFQQAAAFFDLPTAQKREINIEKSACHRGWFGHGEEVLDAQTQSQGDEKEGLKIGRDLPVDHPHVKAGLALHGPNQWPSAASGGPGFKAAMQASFEACEALSRQLMQAFALSLGLEETHFEPWLQLPMATLAPLRYPPSHDDHVLGAGAHTDFGCLTLLLQNDEAGLEVMSPSCEWMAIPASREHLVVNIGDMMARWTNDRYASTRHRVVNRSGKTRHSMAYFFDPDAQADLAPLPNCLDEGESRHYGDATALEHLLMKIEQSFEYRQER